jgi:hypothetical protein
MDFELLGSRLAPAESEKTVRTYHCTRLSSRLLSLKAAGYLTVSNKRVVFYAEGSSYGGTSILQSEVPISDVSGISCYKGTYFSLIRLLTALVVSFVVGSILASLVASIIGGILWSALSRGSLSTAAPEILLWLLALATIVPSFSIPRDRLWRPVLASCGALMLLGAGSLRVASVMVDHLLGGRGGLGNVGLFLGLLAGIYALVCCFWYARSETMSLSIGSKGGSSTPIAIAGISGFGLYNSAALKALTAEPAPDAESMIRELGAMINDIQSLGDFGIQKWTLTQ